MENDASEPGWRAREGAKRLTAGIWIFARYVENGEEAWLWGVLSRDGSTVRFSDEGGNYGPVVADAMRHGFDPRRDYWIVRSEGGTTYYSPSLGGRARPGPVPPEEIRPVLRQLDP